MLLYKRFFQTVDTIDTLSVVFSLPDETRIIGAKCSCISN